MLSIIGIWRLSEKKGIVGDPSTQQEDTASNPKKDKDELQVEGQTEIPDYHYIDNERRYLSSDRYLYVGNEHVLVTYSESIHGEARPDYTKNNQKFVIVYEKNDRTNKKEVELSTLAQRREPELIFGDVQFMLNYQSKDYIIFSMRNQFEMGHPEYKFKIFAFDLDNESIVDIDTTWPIVIGEAENSIESSEGIARQEVIYKSGLYYYAKQNGFTISDLVSFDHDVLNQAPASTLILLNEHSDIQKSVADSSPLYIFPIPSVTPEEWFNQTLHWFSPVDGEPLTVHLIYENDGDKGYPIRSYADYLKATEDKTE